MANKNYKYPGAVGCVKVAFIGGAILGLICLIWMSVANQSGVHNAGLIPLLLLIGPVAFLLIVGVVGLIGIGISRAFRK